MEKEVLFLIAGLIGLWLGSGIAIDFGKKIAEALKISTLIIGLTVTSFLCNYLYVCFNTNIAKNTNK